MLNTEGKSVTLWMKSIALRQTDHQLTAAGNVK
jgi:hypothetical protein